MLAGRGEGGPSARPATTSHVALLLAATRHASVPPNEGSGEGCACRRRTRGHAVKFHEIIGFTVGGLAAVLAIGRLLLAYALAD